MVSAKACVVFLLRHDKRRVLRPYYDCNAQTQLEKNGTRSERLDAYLHMAQLMYVAKHNERLFSDDMYAKDNCGAVSMVLMRSGDPEYVKTGWKQEFEGHETERAFLLWFYDKWADCDIEILHDKSSFAYGVSIFT